MALRAVPQGHLQHNFGNAKPQGIHRNLLWISGVIFTIFWQLAVRG
jgi:hypothetical protein